jgi:hypothetical protein
MRMAPPSQDDEGSSHAKYHLKFDEYVPLPSEQVMRSFSTTMTGSKPTTTLTTSDPSTSTASQQLSTNPPPALPQPSTSTRPRTDSLKRPRAPPPTPASPTRGRFVKITSPSDPPSPDFAYGIIHLYRDVTGTQDAEIASVGRRGATPEEENVLAILAVPSYMTANDFMGFVGEKQRSQVSHFRMIRTEAANRYMVLLKFRTNEVAKTFHADFNGKAFNSMEVSPLPPRPWSRWVLNL